MNGLMQRIPGHIKPIIQSEHFTLQIGTSANGGNGSVTSNLSIELGGLGFRLYRGDGNLLEKML